jgi:tetratricopeptide (TPR) repeat protein
VIELARGDAEWLLAVSERLTDEPNVKYRTEARAQAMELLKQQVAHPGTKPESAATLAMLCQEHGDYAAAAAHYRQALDGDYGQTHWRISLARCLAELGQVDTAIHHARICLRLDPEMPAARQLIEQLAVKPKVQPDPASAPSSQPLSSQPAS